METSARVTIRDVASRAGVSVPTVSKVLNNRYGVATDTQARVRAVIEELGYEASIVARSLRNHQTNVVGVLVSDITPFCAELLKGLAEGVRDTGFELVIYSAGGRAGDRVAWERRYLSRLSDTLIDGAILVTPTVVDVQYGAPIVAVDPHAGPSSLPTVESDNLCGARLATDHLLAPGHRRIAMVPGRRDLEAAARRQPGHRLAAGPRPIAGGPGRRAWGSGGGAGPGRRGAWQGAGRGGQWTAPGPRPCFRGHSPRRARRCPDPPVRAAAVFAASDMSAIAT